MSTEGVEKSKLTEEEFCSLRDRNRDASSGVELSDRDRAEMDLLQRLAVLTAAITVKELSSEPEELAGTLRPGYKEITNYLRNELEINREYIDKVVEKTIGNRVQAAVDKRLTPELLEKFMMAAVTDANSNWQSESVKAQFAKAVVKETKAALGTLLLKEIEIDFKIRPAVEKQGDDAAK